MIKFQLKSKPKTARPLQQKLKIHQSVIKKSDAQLTDILINGVQLPGYKKLTDHKRKRHKNQYLSTSYYEAISKQTQQQMSGLFRNTAIRTRLKSLQIQINKTARHRNSLQKRFSCQSQTPNNLDLFIKTSPFMYQKPKNQRYDSAQTVLNWTHRTFKVKKNIEQSVRCHSTKNRTQNPLWTSHHHFIGLHSKNEQRIAQSGSRLSNSKGFNDSLRAKKKEFLSLRKSQGSREVPLIENSPIEDADGSQIYKSVFRQSANQSKTRNKVCYSIKLRREQKQAKITTQFKSTKAVLPDFEQQETANDN